MSLAVVRRGMALGLSLVLLVAATALADDLKADADSLDGIQNSINLGDVEPGSTHGVDVGFVLDLQEPQPPDRRRDAGDRGGLARHPDGREPRRDARPARGPGRVARRQQPVLRQRGSRHRDPGAPRRDRARHRGQRLRLLALLPALGRRDDRQPDRLQRLPERRRRAAAPAGRHHRSQPPRRPRGHHRDHDRRRRDRPLDGPDGDRRHRRLPVGLLRPCERQPVRPRHDDRDLHGDRRLGQRRERHVHGDRQPRHAAAAHQRPHRRLRPAARGRVPGARRPCRPDDPAEARRP